MPTSPQAKVYLDDNGNPITPKAQASSQPGASAAKVYLDDNGNPMSTSAWSPVAEDAKKWTPVDEGTPHSSPPPGFVAADELDAAAPPPPPGFVPADSPQADPEKHAGILFKAWDWANRGLISPERFQKTIGG